METIEPEIVPAKNEDNPYAYLERDQFTSEKFKVEIRGLPKFYGLVEFKKFLNKKLKLNCSKVKPPKLRSRWIYVCFRSEDDRQNAIKLLDGCKWKKSTLSAMVSTATPDPLVKRRGELMENIKNGEAHANDNLQKYQNIVPLYDVDYIEQLNIKRKIVADVMKSLGQQLVGCNKYNLFVKSWLLKQLQQWNGFPCELEDVKPSPTINGYRNKCEFTIGINEETNEKTIGFRIATYATGSTSVCSVSDMPHVPQCMKDIIQIFELFVRQSELDIFNPENHNGYWRQLTIRLGTITNEIMVIVGIHPQQLNETELNVLKQDIVKLFAEGIGKACNLTSLYMEFILKRNSGDDRQQRRFEHLHGSSIITEKLYESVFNIPPESFFQVNTAACEILYAEVKQLAQLTAHTTLLDICSGIGTIGICLAKFCKRVIGIESDEIAVKNALRNSEQNNIQNCKFTSGKVEDTMASILSSIALDEDVVAVVDPPRAGLHQKALVQLRNAACIKRIIYLACNPKAALQNMVNLGKPKSKTMLREPFFLSKAIPVDMFPHTKHCELILCFERFNPENCTNDDNNVNIEVYDKSQTVYIDNTEDPTISLTNIAASAENVDLDIHDTTKP